MPTREWRCPRCKESIGEVTRDNDLILTAPSATLERTRTGAVIHCRCGKAMLWAGRRVIVNPSVLRPVGS